MDIGDAGYKFSIEIERADSDDIQLMEIFCFDLMLASLWSKKNRKSGFLVHDSTLFADVDERQIVLAIELAKNVSEKYGFQYICCLNSDKVPNSKFTKDFRFENYIRLELKDNKPENSLFGFRF